MNSNPQKQHEWLQQLVGKWTYESECWMEPGKPPEQFKGSEHVRSIGGLWIQGESHGEMPGGGIATNVITLGFDPQRERYVGTFIGSMMTHLWLYDGSLDAAEKILTLNTEGPSYTGDGKLGDFQKIIYPSGGPNQDVPFWQDWVSFQSGFNRQHRLLRQ